MIRKHLIFSGLIGLVALMAGCTLEEPFNGDFCPTTELRENGEYLSYILVNNDKCLQAMCRSKS